MEVRQFVSEKLYNRWIEYNKDQLEITQEGLVDGKYRLTFKTPTGFTWIFDGPHSMDQYPAHR